MNAKLVLLGSGAALVPAIAVPASLSLRASNPEIEVEEEKRSQAKSTEKPRKVEKTTFEPFSKKRGTNAKEDFYMSRYQGYFLHPYQNEQEWKDKFAKLSSSDSNTITIYVDNHYDEEKALEITKSWSPPSELGKQGNKDLSLNLFCSQFYYSEGKKKDGSWNFNPSDNLTIPLEENGFWQFCSRFDEKPDTVADLEKHGHMPYQNDQIGYLLRELLVSVQANSIFWNKRQPEWESLKTTDSNYFSPKQAPTKTIRELCGDAYSKVEESPGFPSKEEVKKYCGLEWDF